MRRGVPLVIDDEHPDGRSRRGNDSVTMVRFRILGPLEVAYGGSLLALGGAKQRALLASLLLSADEVVPADRLVEALWGERPPESGRKALQVHVSQLRKALGSVGGLIVTREPGYVLELGREELDLHVFERLVSEADAAQPATAAVKLREALALWRGPPLADLSYEVFAQPAIARLEELRLVGVEKRVDADLALGRHAELVGELGALVAEHPMRERPRAQLMLALYRCGRQVDALAVFRSTRRALVDQLGIEPGVPLRELEQAILRQDPGLDQNPPRPARISPAGQVPGVVRMDSVGARSRWRLDGITSRGVTVVGRLRELEELGRLIADPEVGLLTLVGTGGIGKTALALEAARAAMPAFADGVTVVRLGSIVSEGQVFTELARVLGVDLSAHDPPIETIARVLHGQHRLIVLDNFEHVLEAAPAISGLAADCPRLKLLVTSRAPLRVGLERVYRVPPLSVPDVDGPLSAEQLRRSPAVALFLAHAAAAASTLTLTADAQAISELCRYLGGLPLALELAASRTAVLSPAEILERLRTGRESLGPPRRDAPERQRTLQATIDWSLQLLPPPERTVFARLVLFTSGFTVDAVEAVCSDLDVSVVDALSGLTDHGLIHQVPARHGTRMKMLEPIRDIARERLREDPANQQAVRRYCEYYATLAERMLGHDGGSQMHWLDRLDDEQANLRGILQSAETPSQLELALQIAGALHRYWSVRDLSPEVASFLTRAIEQAHSDRAARARALFTLGKASDQIGDWRSATVALEDCLALCDPHDDTELTTLTLALLTVVLTEQGRVNEAAAHRERALALAADVKNPIIRADTLLLCAFTDTPADPQLMRQALALYRSAGALIGPTYVNNALGYDALLAGDYTLSRAALEEALAGAEEISATGHTGFIRGNLGLLELLDGRTGQARAHLSAALAILSRSGHPGAAREALIGLAAVAISEDARDQSVRLLSSAELLHDGPRTPAEDLLYERYLGPVTTQRHESHAPHRSQPPPSDLETLRWQVAHDRAVSANPSRDAAPARE